MATPDRTPKTMSSRLLTMKFMQRAAASPSSSQVSPSEPASKRPRLSNVSFTSTPSSTPRSDAEAVADALAAEERKREEALEREAADKGETKWVLSFKEPQIAAQESPLRVISAGYAALDAAKEHLSEDDPQRGQEQEQEQEQIMIGRRNYGKFNRHSENRQNAGSTNGGNVDDSNESGDRNEDEDDPTGANQMIREVAGDRIREERKGKRKSETVESQRMAEQRRQKLVKLNKLTSISGGGGTSDIRCYNCGRKGHVKKDCPQARTINRHGGSAADVL